MSRRFCEVATVPVADVAHASEIAANAVREHGLVVQDVTVLQDSNRAVLLLEPAQVVVRAGDTNKETVTRFRRELSISRKLVERGAPVAPPHRQFDPRPLESDRLVLSFWQYFPQPTPRRLDYKDYALRLRALHTTMAQLDVRPAHYLLQAVGARQSLQDPARLPALGRADRDFLSAVLDRTLRDVRAREPNRLQPLHGQPHADNVLLNQTGRITFTDFESCVLGPAEFDVADAPEEVAGHYPALDQPLVSACRWLWEAMVCVWCWNGYARHPNLTRAADSLLSNLKNAASDGRLRGVEP